MPPKKDRYQMPLPLWSQGQLALRRDTNQTVRITDYHFEFYRGTKEYQTIYVCWNLVTNQREEINERNLE